MLEIARKDIEPDQKEAELRALPEAFRHMTTRWFPVLRHTNYEIEYILPDFTAQASPRHGNGRSFTLELT